MEPSQAFARNLRRERLGAGLSQEALAQASGMHMSEISRLERAVRDPRLSTIVRVARALGISAALLVTEID